MRTTQELRACIEALYATDERWDKVDYLGRLWVASYVADADAIADCLLELLDGAELPKDAA